MPDNFKNVICMICTIVHIFKQWTTGISENVAIDIPRREWSYKYWLFRNVAIDVSFAEMWLQIFALQDCGFTYWPYKNLAQIFRVHECYSWHFLWKYFPCKPVAIHFKISATDISQWRLQLQIISVQDCSFRYFPTKTEASDISLAIL